MPTIQDMNAAAGTFSDSTTEAAILTMLQEAGADVTAAARIANEVNSGTRSMANVNYWIPQAGQNAGKGTTNSATGGATLNTVDDILGAVGDLFTTRIQATQARSEARLAEIQAARDMFAQQEFARTGLRIGAEGGARDRRISAEENQFFTVSEGLTQALQALTTRLTRQRENTLGDIAFAKEADLRKVINNALDRGIFRSGIREANEGRVEDRAADLVGRAESEFTEELDIGQERTELELGAAERKRDLEIEDAMADYQDLLASLEFERDTAIETLDMNSANEKQAEIYATSDKLAQLQIELASRQADAGAAQAQFEQQMSQLGAPVGGAASPSVSSGAASTPTPSYVSTSSGNTSPGGVDLAAAEYAALIDARRAAAGIPGYGDNRVAPTYTSTIVPDVTYTPPTYSAGPAVDEQKLAAAVANIAPVVVPKNIMPPPPAPKADYRTYLERGQ